MSPVTIRTRKVRLQDHQGGERTLILVSSSNGKQQHIKANHLPAILNHSRNVTSLAVPKTQTNTVIVSRAKTSTHVPIILSENNRVNHTPKATVIYAGSRSISPKFPTIVSNNTSGQVTRILSSSSGNNIKTTTCPAPPIFKAPFAAPQVQQQTGKTFVRIVSSGNNRGGGSSPGGGGSTAVVAAADRESRGGGGGALLQQNQPPRPERPGTPAPWSDSAEQGVGQQWSGGRACTSRPPTSFCSSLPRPRWPTVDPDYKAPLIQLQVKPRVSPPSSPAIPYSHAGNRNTTTDQNGNIIKQEIKTEIKQEMDDSLPLEHILLAPLKRRYRDLSEVRDLMKPPKKKGKISIAQDNKLGPVKEHVNTVFEHYGVTPSFSPNMEKLIEITGTTALNYLLYVDWCEKKKMKTVNQETYGRLFRNEFKKLVGTR